MSMLRIKPIHPGFIMPTKGTEESGAWDLYMPIQGKATAHPQLVGLGFCAAVPFGNVGMILPRSGIGAKYGVELNNTAGIIDPDYIGEWRVAIRTKNGSPYHWEKGDRLFQLLIVPVTKIQLGIVDELDETARGAGGFGSSGN